MKIIKKQLLLIIAVLCLAVAGLAAQNTIVRGTILDENTGEPLMFATVAVVGTTKGVDTDLDGAFELSIEPGVYSLEFSYLGYTSKILTDFVAETGKTDVITILLKEAGETLEEIVVVARQLKNTEGALIALQRKALSIQDGISADVMKRFASSSAADAIVRTPGASVVDGKYVIIRGLGDRYSNAMMNGLLLPSTDPYRNSTQLDLIPANLLDNVLSLKTFTPDMPGNFTGGSINIKTKTFPEEFTFNVSVSSQYNTQSSWNDRFLTHQGGQTDWLGYDRGFRAIPSVLTDSVTLTTLRSSTYITAARNEEVATILDQSSKALNPQMAPVQAKSGLNSSVSFSLGNQFKLAGNPLGILVGGNFKRRFSYIEKGENNFWELTGNGAEQLNVYYDFDETLGVESPTIGGLFNIAYKMGKHSSISFNTLYNHDTDKSSRYLSGALPGSLASGLLESRTLEFRERELLSYQLLSTHKLAKSGVEIEWGASIVDMTQAEPDLRKFANSYEMTNGEATHYGIERSEFPVPQHIWRDLNDVQHLAKLDISIPFWKKGSTANKVKIGALYTSKDRNFSELPYELNERSSTAPNYNGKDDFFFGSESFGVLGVNPDNDRYIIGNYWMDQELLALENSYTGNETVKAAYGMAVVDLDRLKIVAGARLEQTNIHVASMDTTEMQGAIDTLDILPSFSLIYKLNENMNLRASYTHTVARPNMRELAPFSSDDFIGGFKISGNPLLERTLVRNIDLRWEWYPKPGELVAISSFYKGFESPIVKAFLPIAANPTIQFQNVEQAQVYGLEMEFRKSLAFVHPHLEKFKFSSNISIIRSFVDIPEEELAGIRLHNPEKGTTRPFFGQSNFLLNTALNYSDRERGFDALLSLNVFGKRLVQQSEAEIPDVYEASRPQLDLSIQKTISKHFDIRLLVQNILNAATLHTMSYLDRNYTVLRYNRGVNYSIGLSYRL